MAMERYSLTFDEMARARTYFHKYVEEYITTEFQMRTILSEMGQYPPSREIAFCLESFGGKVSFNNFCNYCSYLKKKSSKPEPKDVDTLRAFVALGGGGDRSGDISTDDLRSTCKHFELTIDIDRMLAEVDEDGSGTIDYDEFKGMWEIGTPTEADIEVDIGGRPLQRKVSLGLLREDDIALDEEDNLNVVRGFLFPLERKQTMAAEMVAREMAKRKSAARGKSFVRLPPIGGGRHMSLMEQSARQEKEDEQEDKSGLKPMPPPAMTARQSVVGFVPPSPTVLDFRRSHKKRNSSTSPRVTPRKPAGAQTARGPKRSSRLY